MFQLFGALFDHLLIFFFSIFLLFFFGKWLVDGLVKIACFLKLREFVIAFFIIALAGSVPNFFFGIFSTFKGAPQLSFGDVVGGNVVDLTIVIALSVLLGQGLPAKSRMVQGSAIFTSLIAVLPLLLVLDGVLSRLDGLFLISFFFIYVFWLFSKKERFSKVYCVEEEVSLLKELKGFFIGLIKIMLGLAALLIASRGMVETGYYFSEALGLPLVLVGILIVGLGNAFPETYFTIISARKKQNWLVLGDLMGSVIVCSTLVLGTVAFIQPIEIVNFLPLVVARLFLIASAFFFLVFVRTEQQITKKEGLFLLSIYIFFIIIEIFIR